METAWRGIRIWPYNLDKTLAICAQKPSNISTKKTNVRFMSKILMLSYAMQQLAKQEQFSAGNIYI